MGIWMRARKIDRRYVSPWGHNFVTELMEQFSLLRQLYIYIYFQSENVPKLFHIHNPISNNHDFKSLFSYFIPSSQIKLGNCYQHKHSNIVALVNSSKFNCFKISSFRSSHLFTNGSLLIAFTLSVGSLLNTLELLGIPQLESPRDPHHSWPFFRRSLLPFLGGLWVRISLVPEGLEGGWKICLFALLCLVKVRVEWLWCRG